MKHTEFRLKFEGQDEISAEYAATLNKQVSHFVFYLAEAVEAMLGGFDHSMNGDTDGVNIIWKLVPHPPTLSPVDHGSGEVIISLETPKTVIDDVMCLSLNEDGRFKHGDGRWELYSSSSLVHAVENSVRQALCSTTGARVHHMTVA